MTHPKWKASILDLLDDKLSDYEFPIFDNANWFFGAAQLSAFCSDKEWLILVDAVIYQRQGCTFDEVLYGYGNRIETSGHIGWTDSPELPKAIDEAPGHPLLTPTGDCALDPYHFTVSIRGEPQTFTLTPDDYRAAGIDPDGPMETPAKILRLIVHRRGKALFGSPTDLLAIVGRGGARLDHLITLDEWIHPDGLDTDASECESFQQIAAALATADAGLIRPTQPANTHWSNWTNME